MTGYDIAFPFIMILWVVIMIGAGFYLITNEPISKNKSRENKNRAKAGNTQKAKGRNKTKNIKKENRRNKSKNKK